MNRHLPISIRRRLKRITIISLLMVMLGAADSYPFTIRIVSAENMETLPYATVEIPGIGYGVADEEGEIRFDFPSELTQAHATVRAFNHLPETFEISAKDSTLIASMQPRYLDLKETTVSPLPKGKRKYLGKKTNGPITASMAVPNKKPTAGQLDSLGRLYSLGQGVFMGLELETRKNKFNRLTGLGINIAKSKKMIPCISFRVRIFDADTISTPDHHPREIYEPIYFDVRKEDVNHDTFLYHLPTPLDMPPTAILTVEIINFIPADTITIADFRYRTKKGRWYTDLDPLTEQESTWIFKRRRPCIMYAEYMEYDAPE